MNPNTTTAIPPEGVVTTAPDPTHIAFGRELKALLIRHDIRDAEVSIERPGMSRTRYHYLRAGLRVTPEGNRIETTNWLSYSFETRSHGDVE